MNYVLDACAMIAVLNGEEGAGVVKELFEKAEAGEITVSMHASTFNTAVSAPRGPMMIVFGVPPAVTGFFFRIVTWTSVPAAFYFLLFRFLTVAIKIFRISSQSAAILVYSSSER
jgi:hypothetical protein